MVRSAKPILSHEGLKQSIGDILQNRNYSPVEKVDFDHLISGKDPIYTTDYPNGRGVYGTGYKADIALMHPKFHPDILCIQCRSQQISGSTDSKFPYDVLSIKEGKYGTIIVLGGDKHRANAKEWLHNHTGKDMLRGVFDHDDFPKSINQHGKITCSCEHHYREENQTHLDTVMKDLPENQGGAGRHKCPYCAYERGWQDAIAELTKPVTSRHPR